MKKLFLFVLVAIGLNASAQNLSGKTITALEKLTLRDYSVKAIQRDTGQFTFSDSSKVPTAKAVYDWVRQRLTEMGGGAVTPPNLPGQYFNGYNNWSSLNTDSIAIEGLTNLWHTPARVRAALSANTAQFMTYNSGTGQFGIDTSKLHSLAYLMTIFQVIGGDGIPPLYSVTAVDSTTPNALIIQNAILRAMNGGGSLFMGYKAGSGGDPGDGNTGINVIGFGPGACINNTANGVFAVGYQAAKNNSGSGLVNALGAGAAFANSGHDVNALGFNAGLNNIYNDVNLFGNNATADSSSQTVFGGARNARFNFGKLTANRKYNVPNASGTLVLSIDGKAADSLGNVQSLFDSTKYYKKLQVDSLAAVLRSEMATAGGYPPGVGMNTSDGRMNLGGDIGSSVIDITSSSNGVGIVIDPAIDRNVKIGAVGTTTMNVWGLDGFVDASGFSQFILPNMITSRGINYTMPATDADGFLHSDGAGNLGFQSAAVFPPDAPGILTCDLFGNKTWELVLYPAAANTTKKYLNGYYQWGALNTDSLNEGSTNKFYTDTRARSAISLTHNAATQSTYVSGVLNIPDNVDSLRRVGVNVQARKNGVWTNQYVDSLGAGGSGSSPATDTIYTVPVTGVKMDTTIVGTDTTIYIKGDTTILSTKWYSKHYADSIAALKVTANGAITGATKTKITYDSKGLVTAGADIGASDLPTGIDAAKLSAGSVSNTEFDRIDGLTSNAQTQIDSKVSKSQAAYTMQANNTGSTGNMSDQPFRNPGGALTYSGTITWTGTTAPSGTTNHQYSWGQVGKEVQLHVILNYGTAGVSATSCVIDLPSDCPLPLVKSGLNVAGNMLGFGTGMITTGPTSLQSASGRVYMKYVNSTSFQVSTTAAASSAAMLYVDINYTAQ